ncbi:hypothetical protein ZWY2020_022240 [Hordeum vulgare]|nr:hypothetical protein ZWY2020_022240 [Hordeum vulgare]
MGGSDHNHKAAGGAVGGKAARACDGCMRRRARWYCAADDAFLCQGCDTSVHSANPLARRHERLRLRVTSPLPAEGVAAAVKGSPATTSKCLDVAPAWPKRKARTRRPTVKSVGQLLSRRLVVPEVGAGESSTSDERRAPEEEQLLYRVPVFDPALGEFCSPPPIDDAVAATSRHGEDVEGAVEDAKELMATPSPVQELPDCFASFGPTDADLREFAADMEALLGQGLDDGNELEDSFYMEALGLISPAPEHGGRVKVEADGGLVSRSNGVLAAGHDLKREFNGSPPTLVDDDDSFEHKTSSASNGDAVDGAQFLKRSLDLRLNYEAVIESWASSPWTDGRRPPGQQLDDLLLNDHAGMWTAGGGGRQGEAAWPARPRTDGWREARVSRYREKRRTRLFAKKIRYEVRKLNAEKRPRMKGRFVKRTGAAPCAVT